MDPHTLALWEKQDSHSGDRKRLFSAVGDAVKVSTVLYPGSYVDISPSTVFESVTYVDVDPRAATFFADASGVAEIVQAEGGLSSSRFSFLQGDYSTDLGIEDESFDLLVSLYAGFVSEACTTYLRVGGALLVAPSHGDVAMASIDPRYELSGVVTSRSGNYRVRGDSLGHYLIPKTNTPVTATLLHERGRGVPYTRSPFAYIFTRIK